MLKLLDKEKLRRIINAQEKEMQSLRTSLALQREQISILEEELRAERQLRAHRERQENAAP